MHDTVYNHWYETIYPRLTGFGLWLRGGEINALPREEYHRRILRVLITRLSTSADTATSATHKLLYSLCKSLPDVFPDLAYLPPKNDAIRFDRDGIPWILGTNTKRGARDFDIIAFSNSIVQELINLPVMLEKSGVPLQKSERIENPAIPLILLGGSNALWTSIFWTHDSPVDGIFVGESIECIENIFSICRDGKRNGMKKTAVLEALESVPGFFQPDRIRKTRKHHDMFLVDQTFFPDMPVLYPEDQPGRGTIQISEGCPSLCSFCSESWVRKPYRELSADTVIERAARMKAAMGLERIELSSFNFNTHHDFYRILDALTDSFETVGLKSMRFDVLSRDPQMLPHLLAAGKNSLTCGLEGISSRLRKYLNKSLSDGDLFQSLKHVFGAPVRELKIFLIATGHEREDDFEAFRHLLKYVSAMRSVSRQSPRIVFSVTPLVRFSRTPLEFEDAPPIGQMETALGAIEKTVAVSGFEYRRASGLSEWWLSQVMVRASDPALYPVFIRALRKTGFVYQKEIPDAFVRTFREELKKEGVDSAPLLSGTKIDVSDNKPWELVETGPSRSFLINQYRKSLTDKDDGSRVGTAKKIHSSDSLKGKIASLRREEKRLDFRVEIGENARGLPRKAVGTALARAFMLSEPGFVPAFRRFQKSLWEERTAAPWITGDDLITLVFRGDLVLNLIPCLDDVCFKRKVNESFKPWGKFNGFMQATPEAVEILVESSFPFDGSAYLKSERLNHILRKENENRYQYELTRDARRKNIICEMTSQNKKDQSCEIRLVAGPKFDPSIFAKRAFVLPQPSDWVRIRMHSTFVKGKALGGKRI